MPELLCVLILVLEISPEFIGLKLYAVVSLCAVCCWASAHYTEGTRTVRCVAEAKRIFRLLANKTSSSKLNRIEKGPGLFYDLI